MSKPIPIISAWHMPAPRIQAICCPCFVPAYSNNGVGLKPGRCNTPCPLDTRILSVQDADADFPLEYGVYAVSFIVTIIIFVPLKVSVPNTPNTKLRLQRQRTPRADLLERSQIEHSFPLLFYLILFFYFWGGKASTASTPNKLGN